MRPYFASTRKERLCLYVGSVALEQSKPVASQRADELAKFTVASSWSDLANREKEGRIDPFNNYPFQRDRWTQEIGRLAYCMDIGIEARLLQSVAKERVEDSDRRSTLRAHEQGWTGGSESQESMMKRGRHPLTAAIGRLLASSIEWDVPPKPKWMRSKPLAAQRIGASGLPLTGLREGLKPDGRDACGLVHESPLRGSGHAEQPML
jgi:hypothetical protein